jgi:chemotaxis methyl-accepting protein methylase
VRIWSAGCATGEEAYSLAILIQERWPERSGRQVEVTGSDISHEAIDIARAGQYGSDGLSEVAPHLLGRYFQAVGSSYRVVPAIRKMVRFTYVNLHDAEMTRTIRGYDIIACRNVLSAFSESAAKDLIRSLYSCLCPGGYLVIGASESLGSRSAAFDPVILSSGVAYRKQAVVSSGGSSANDWGRGGQRDTAASAVGRLPEPSDCLAAAGHGETR